MPAKPERVSALPSRVDVRDTKEFKAAVAALKCLSVRFRQHAFSEATASDLEAQFSSTHGLTKAKSYTCIRRLVGKSCGIRSRKPCDCHPPGNDHASLWLKDGEPYCYVSQPYSLGITTLESAAKFARDHGLELEINAERSFYFPSASILMVYRKPQVL